MVKILSSFQFCRILVATLAFIFTATALVYAAPMLPRDPIGNYQPVSAGENSVANDQGSSEQRTLTAPEFLAADLAMELAQSRTYPFKLDQGSIAVSRADRASFKALLVSRGLTYITEADIRSLEDNANDADIVPESYLLSVSGSRVAIAFTGGKVDGNATRFFSKVVVFKSKTKQYDIEYPSVRNFEDFQMAFARDGRLAVAFNNQVLLESAKLDSRKRVTERSTDLYNVDQNSGAVVLYYNDINQFDPATGKLTKLIRTFLYAASVSSDVDKRVNTYFYDAAGTLTGLQDEVFKDGRLLSSIFDDVFELFDCGSPGAPSPCTLATRTTVRNYIYYNNGRIKQIYTGYTRDPFENKLLREVVEEFANNSRHDLVSSRDTIYSEVDDSLSLIEIYYSYHSNGKLKQKIVREPTGPDANGISTLREVTELFNILGQRTEKKTRTTVLGVLKNVEVLTYYNNFIGGEQVVSKRQTIIYNDTVNQKASERIISYNRSGDVENVVIITYARGIRSRRETSIFSRGNLTLKLIDTFNAAGILIRHEVLQF